MNYKISRELFEAVMSLDIERIEVTNIKINYSKVGQCQEDDDIKFLLMSFTISINDFFFMCKEWAFWNDYEIVVRMRIVDIYRDEHKIDYGYEINHTNNGIIKTSWWIGSEQQAVFDACQWILDNKDKQ